MTEFNIRAAATFLTILSIVIAIYIGFSPQVLSNHMLYMPKPVRAYMNIPTHSFGAQAQPVAFMAPSKNKLYGFYFEKPGSKFTVLLHHGQGGNLETHLGLAKTMLLAGFSVLIYDYEGFGMSTGKASNKAMLEDGVAAYSFLVNTKKIQPSLIIQCGVSLGSAVASHIAQRYPCAAVILISPYISIHQVAIERIPLYKFYPKILFPQPDMGSLSFIKTNRTIPLLLIHGANDPVINVHHAKELNQLAKSPHWLVVEPKAHHGDFSTTFLANQIKLFAEYALPI